MKTISRNRSDHGPGRSRSGTNRPPGVSADEWAPINDSVGVVLVQGMIPTGAERTQTPSVKNLPNTGANLISPI